MRKNKFQKKNVRIKISGKCPYCKENDSVVFTDIYNRAYCIGCDTDDIKIIKVNNRRFKIVGEFY